VIQKDIFLLNAHSQHYTQSSKSCTSLGARLQLCLTQTLG